MKKILKGLFLFMFLITPMVLKAEEEEKTKIDLSKYTTLNFRETLKDEDIEESFKDYKETDDQVTIYLFRGKGCSFCRAFLNYLNSIAGEYGKYFKVVSFETWYDENNTKLLNTVANFTGQSAGGVPYIIIGDKVFPGYNESYNNDIKTKIKAEYDTKDKYDVFEKYNESIAYHMSDGAVAVIWNFIFLAIATFIIVKQNKKSTNKILEMLENNGKTISKKIENDTEEIMSKKVSVNKHAKRKK